MGLDMYVTAERYLWDVGDDKHRDRETSDTIGKLFPEIAGYRVNKVEAEVMYWRKANAIHKWFVDNCQDGVDECQKTYLEHSKLCDLRDICKAVLEDRSQAATLLPVQSGFFFGGTEYDEYYFDEVERTLGWLSGLLVKHALDEKFKEWHFYYQSSW